MKKIFLICILLLGVGTSYSQNQELTSIFDEANRLYLGQQYDAAILKYESILKNGYSNGALYFNLGNAYFKAGKIQNAIINYERAKKFIPNDEDLQFNLQMANVQLVDKVDAIPELFIYRWAQSLLTLFSLKTMLWMIYALFLLTLALFSLFLFAKTYEQKRYSLMTGLICAVLLIFGIANFLVQSYREANTEFAIVMADVANIKSAPDNSGNDAFVLHRGVKVQVLDSVNKWRKIRLGDGKVGWIPEWQCEII
ncbi:MAG: SH3 domain-containing protein [Bacteroidota bacterium]|nr:SH3 domain-containing protein [Bacteroidota bacterium]